MTVRRSSAPGKVVLSGEYAVLDGAPAIAMAVNRRAYVTFDDDAPNARTSIGAADASGSRLLECACQALDIADWSGDAVLDTSAFVDADTSTKLGIGSSAALMVAVVAALQQNGGNATDILGDALRAHRMLQQGQGSGVDVATSLAGGLIEYRIGTAPKKLHWPPGLYYRLLWSGVPASTPRKLEQLAASGSRPGREALNDAAAAVADAWRAGRPNELLLRYRDYISALRQFDVDRDLGIFDAGHDVLLEQSQRTGTVYKPCGAGGGDIGIVFSSDPQAVRTFAAESEQHGFRQLDVTIDDCGVVLDGNGA